MMSHVLQLTRSGLLKDATAAIQAALQRSGAAMPSAELDDSDVIEIEAREIVSPAPDLGRVPLHGPVITPAAKPAPFPESDRSAGQFIDGSHTEKAGTRHYKLFVPPGHHGQALPLVVMLHGCTQNPDDFAAGTRMNEVALRDGFFVLYPAQTHKHNPSRCWNWFKHNHQRRDQGEPAILAGMVRAVVKSHGIDPRRVYVAGLSAGGAMAAILGDAYPDLFAAVGVHSGLATGSARDVASAFAAMQGGSAAAPRSGARPPTIVFHGDQDQTVHPVNGERVLATPGTPGVVIERIRGEHGRTYTQHVHRDGGGRVVAEHWVVHGGGHAWSGGSAQGSYTDPSGPDASREMLRFFRTQILPVQA
jgi:poly(hydroxyalkanoate) depolymerase family esterase